MRLIAFALQTIAQHDCSHRPNHWMIQDWQAKPIDICDDVDTIEDMAHAKRNGETGINGEFYKGGQFLPNSETTVKGAQNGMSGKPAHKSQIAPRVYELPPTPTARPIFAMVGFFLKRDWNEADTISVFKDESVWGYSAQELCDLYNGGERWVEPK